MNKSVSLFVETAPSPYAAYIGIDWTDRKHDVCLYNPDVQQLESSVIGSQSESMYNLAGERRLTGKDDTSF